MPVWQIQMQTTDIWSGPGWWHVSKKKIDEILKDLPNVFGTADDILVVGYDAYGRDHDNTLQRLLLICRKNKSEIKQTSFQVEVDFLWNRTVDSLKTSFHPLLWKPSDLKDSWKTTPYMGNGKLTKHAQNLKRCEKCNLRKAVGNLEMPYGCEITVIVQEELKICYLVSYIS